MVGTVATCSMLRLECLVLRSWILCLSMANGASIRGGAGVGGHDEVEDEDSASDDVGEAVRGHVRSEGRVLSLGLCNLGRRTWWGLGDGGRGRR